MAKSTEMANIFDHWLAALNGRGDSRQTKRACADAALVERCGFFGDRGRVVEQLHGIAAINAWLALTREICVFSLDGAVAIGDPGFEVRYRIVAGDFVGGGHWIARFDSAGKITWLKHQPDELAEIAENSEQSPPHRHHDHGKSQH